MTEDVNIIEIAIGVISKNIEAIINKNYEEFVSSFSPQIAEMINQESFQKALDLYEKVPLSIEAIDKEASQIITENNVKLILVKESGSRTLCNIIKLENDWFIDQIYWK